LPQEKLVKLSNDRQIVFIGDTHGDISASQLVARDFPPEKNVLVFLGDYVDRGEYSRENLEYLLDLRKKYPGRVILLMGNHETFPVMELSPADFWVSLSSEELKHYAEIVVNLPLAVSVGNILALHGGLPEIDSIEDINSVRIDANDRNFNDIMWGDFVNEEHDGFIFRPRFGKKRFLNVMGKLNKKILVRAHDPHAETFMYEGRSVTLMTSRYYACARKVAVLKRGHVPETGMDLKIIDLDRR